ncbi:transglutaminase family protein [Burkholderia guangdongensis]|uniref:transglutaminase family protein n=1 Tax=Burkholderia guangdongensis TaxID=1792500 RepID=UPI0015C78B7D|nr:transglutaminase domain-containing protein [Burkholderia guangdongensis]
MRLAIRHISRYRFDDQVTHVLQRLRLRPQSGPGQTVRAWQVTIDGIEPTLSYADGLGNKIDLVRHERATRAEIVIVAAGVVETQDRAGILGQTEGYAPPWIFERETELTGAGDGIRALADAMPLEHRSLDALHWLMTEVHGRIAYAPQTAFDAPVDAETALKNGEGTSRDHAHAFIAAARALKVPARFVAGYLLADGPAQRMADAMQQQGGATQQQQQGGAQQEALAAIQLAEEDEESEAAGQSNRAARRSSGTAQPSLGTQQQSAAQMPSPAGHAWAEAYVEGLGWVGFDPFMNRCPDERYVRIAVGLDYRDTQSVTGSGTQPIGVDISVVQSPELV